MCRYTFNVVYVLVLSLFPPLLLAFEYLFSHMHTYCQQESVFAFPYTNLLHNYKTYWQALWGRGYKGCSRDHRSLFKVHIPRV